MNELAEAKRKLYSLLLLKKDWTDIEIQIGYYLTCDYDIQKILQEALEKGKQNEIGRAHV